MEAVRNLKANLKIAGKPCGWCQQALTIGEDASVCTACEREHHQRCWDGKAGCASDGCVNAPLRRLDPPVAAGAPAMAARLPDYGPGMMACRTCRTPVAISAAFCPACRSILSPDGIYRGPLTNAPGAVQSMVIAILGFFLCGIVMGPIAIAKASEARKAMAADPTLGGGGYATAGMVIGIFDIVAFVIALAVRMSAMR